jgi:hypothetical protein
MFLILDISMFLILDILIFLYEFVPNMSESLFLLRLGQYLKANLFTDLLCNLPTLVFHDILSTW